MWVKKYEKHETALSDKLYRAGGPVCRRDPDGPAGRQRHEAEDHPVHLAVQLPDHHGGVAESGAGLSGAAVPGALRLHGRRRLYGGADLPGVPACGCIRGEIRPHLSAGAAAERAGRWGGRRSAGPAGGYSGPAAEGRLSGHHHPGLRHDHRQPDQQPALLRAAGPRPGLRLLVAVCHRPGLFQR